MHANSVYGGNILAVTAIPNALWRSALVAHTTAVCTVFPFPAQVLFHRYMFNANLSNSILSGITFTLRRYRIWQTPYRNTVATHFTPVCTVFPFPAQVLFHPPQV